MYIYQHIESLICLLAEVPMLNNVISWMVSPSAILHSFSFVSLYHHAPYNPIPFNHAWKSVLNRTLFNNYCILFWFTLFVFSRPIPLKPWISKACMVFNCKTKDTAVDDSFTQFVIIYKYTYFLHFSQCTLTIWQCTLCN